MNKPEKPEKFLRELTSRVLPRLLTQICRDPGNPSYGSCDRNWWHYKIRDFSSIILQQAGYTLFVASESFSFPEEIQKLSTATCRFWNARAIKHGAFEEYYPFEQGYPPLAFSTLAVAKLCEQGVVPLDDMLPGFKIASRQLLRRFEPEAMNQQVAGLAALSVIRSLVPSLVPDIDFDNLMSRTLASQETEGWFPEYDGPDLGYLSVTLDCLWDIYDFTGDERCLNAIDSAFEYLTWFILSPVGTAGMHNSRNTDYIVPYGIARLACENGKNSGLATSILNKLYIRNEASPHFFDAVDDRYWCHYIGHSVFRALNLLTAKNNQSAENSSINTVISDSKPDSGHYILGLKDENIGGILVSTKKGGILTAVWQNGAIASDFGWIVETHKGLYVSHWWSKDWNVSKDNQELRICGYMIPHKEHISTPLKHFILRIASFVAGYKIIKLLKKLIIFKHSDTSFKFDRTINCDNGVVTIRDQISGLNDSCKLIRAPRSSKRHVASADSFHLEDLAASRGCEMIEDVSRSASNTTITTKYKILS